MITSYIYNIVFITIQCSYINNPVCVDHVAYKKTFLAAVWIMDTQSIPELAVNKAKASVVTRCSLRFEVRHLSLHASMPLRLSVFSW